MSVDVQAREVRRQAMLQVMQLDVWLPRQSLPFAAESRDFLLNWPLESEPEPGSEPAEQAQVARTPNTPSSGSAEALVAQPQQVHNQLQQIRQTLAGEQATTPIAQELEPIAQVVIPEPSAPAQDIPRFTLQILRSGNCLVLLDLPVSEPLQGRDPEYLLLKDILRAAQLPHEPSLLRNAEPIRWPLLSVGSLAHSQDSQAARSYVRELLSIECAQQPTSMIWLLGENAVRFANVSDEFADDFGVTAFQHELQLWSLPSLEQLMHNPDLKRQLWQSMQLRMPRWINNG